MDKTRDSTNSKIWPNSTCAISVRRKGQILLVVESLVLSTTFTAPTFFQKSYKFHHSHNTKFTKKNASLCKRKPRKKTKFYKFSTRAPKKGHAGYVTGRHVQPPHPVKIPAFLLLLT